MFGSATIRVQSLLVVALFVGALATIVYATAQAFWIPRREAEARRTLAEAAGRMAQEGASAIGTATISDFEALTLRLRGVSGQILNSYPGVEGGFYLAEPIDRFAGRHFPDEPGPVPHPPAAERHRSDDPPPKETPFILAQVRDSLQLPAGEVQFDVRTVGPSRVAFLTQPAGGRGQPAMAVWTMLRIVDPELLESNLRRFQVSAALAVVGMALAVLLTWSLRRRLAHQHLEEERLREELRRAAHLAALGKLLAGVAHEVRNPLAAIRSTVQLWQRLPDTTRSGESLNGIVRAVDRLNEMVSRLLNFSRAGAAERQTVSVETVLTETLQALEREAAAHSVVVETDLASNLPRVRAAATALNQVFTNLALNAFDAMPRGGRLHCTTRLLPDRRMIEITFADTGTGVPEEVRGHLFEPFFTTKPQGTGLGLALCAEIVNQHGGRIELADMDAGATFRVVLPVAM